MKTQRPGLRRLLEYARPHRRTVVLATAYSILNKILDLAPPLLIGAAVDVVVKREDSWVARFGFPEVESQLWILVIGTLIIWGLESLFEYLYSVQWRNLAQTVQHELRQDGYGHLQQLDLAFFEDSSTGDDYVSLVRARFDLIFDESFE